MKISKIPFIFFITILLIFFYLLNIERNPSEVPSALLNKKIPNFGAQSLFSDKKFISSKEFGNEIMLVNFFATWCKPCKEEHDFLNLFFSEKKIKIIGINYKDNPKKTVKWLKKLGNPYDNVLLDRKGKIAIDWGVYGIPETFIVSAAGIIKYRHVGPISKKEYKKINFIIDNINDN